jgi:hypothetical protein
MVVKKRKMIDKIIITIILMINTVKIRINGRDTIINRKPNPFLR